MNHIVSSTTIAMLFGLGSASCLAATLHAKADGATQGTCIGWSDACTLGRALAVAQSGDQIWVKAGTYGPVTLANGVRMIGGFAGTETSASQSNPTANATVIDGAGAQAVLSDSNGPTTMLRGFRITNGSAGGDFDGGGGLLLQNSSAVFAQCTFDHNRADHFGAAVAIHGTGSPYFVNCIFHDNGSGDGTAVKPLAGGAVYLRGGTPMFANCLFYDNVSGEGAVLANVSGVPTFINCTIVSNHARIGYGGAIHDDEAMASVRNSILWNNTAVKGGSQIYNRTGFATLANYSDIEGGWAGTGNLSVDPQFVDSGTDNYRLTERSPCKNKGQNSALSLSKDVPDLDWDGNLTEEIPLDLAQLARTNLIVDIGAYEIQVGTPSPDLQE